MSGISRRDFLKRSAIAGSAVALPAFSYDRVLGANADLRVACVGINSRGGDHIRGFHRLPGVRVVALCDADRSVLTKRREEFAKNGSVDTFLDLRKMLERDDIDVVSVASPNHWHALMAIWSMQAGKDVYLEKPVSHNVWEGRQIVKWARKLGRIVQAGTQSRSNPGMQEAVRFVHEGGIGKLRHVRGLCYKPRQSIGKVSEPQPVPRSVEYDYWLGPAPFQPLWRKRLHYDWHWVFDTGNGDLGNQGIHQMDIARWLLNEPKLSPRVLSIGGRLGYDDDGNTPNTQVIIHDYARAPLIFEVRGLPKAQQYQSDGKAWGGHMPDYRGVRIGVVADGEAGSLLVGSYSGAVAFDGDGHEIRKFKGGADHYANFIRAVRSRKVEELHADIEEGHISSALCHTGNISHRLGKTATPEEIEKKLEIHEVPSEAYGRMGEHLEKNGVDLEKTPLTRGAWLTMDPDTERFERNEIADRMLTRDYRGAYVVPDAGESEKR